MQCPLLGVKRTLRPAALNGAIMVPANVRLPRCAPIAGAAVWLNSVDYVIWTTEVVQGLRAASALLEQEFDRAAADAERTIPLAQ
jgi:hypothetical protein